MEQCIAFNKTGTKCKKDSVANRLCLKHKDYIHTEKYGTNTITLTFGDHAENHVGMQKIGADIKNGYSIDDFIKIKESNKDLNIEIIDLKDGLIDTEYHNKADNAYLLIIRNGINDILKNVGILKTEHDLYLEHKELTWDTKAKMYGRVVNKKARHNLTYADFEQVADYANGKGTIVPFNRLPLTQIIKNKLPELFLDKSKNLVAEGNLYYDINYNYISAHGDSERRLVIGIRLGNDFPFKYHWYHDTKPIGKSMDFNFKSGDIYIMSEKAVGFDWKSRSKITLRHLAGYIDFGNSDETV